MALTDLQEALANYITKYNTNYQSPELFDSLVKSYISRNITIDDWNAVAEHLRNCADTSESLYTAIVKFKNWIHDTSNHDVSSENVIFDDGQTLDQVIDSTLNTLDNKLDKTNIGAQVYGTDEDGEQRTITYDVLPGADTIALRSNTGDCDFNNVGIGIGKGIAFHYTNANGGISDEWLDINGVNKLKNLNVDSLATKDYVDNNFTPKPTPATHPAISTVKVLNSQGQWEEKSITHGLTVGTAYSIVQRDQNANIIAKTPTDSNHVANKQYVDSEIASAVARVYKYRGSVATYNNLPTNNLNVGYVYNVRDTGDNYAWDGTAWDKLAGTVDLSDYATKEYVDNDTGVKLANSLIDSGINKGSGDYSIQMGFNSTANGKYSHAEGCKTTAEGEASHAEGSNTSATKARAHAEGDHCTASGYNAHAEGDRSIASGNNSHAEGGSTKASGDYSHAEGYNTKAEGVASHAEGSGTITEGVDSHAEGYQTTAKGRYSHAEGYYTQAVVDYQHVSGKYNIGKTDTLFEIGNGASNDNRKNAFEVCTDGHAEVQITGTTDASIVRKDYVDKNTDVKNKTFTNPVLINEGTVDYFPDPTVWQGDDGYFYALATSYNKHIFRSVDLVNWEDCGYAPITTDAVSTMQGWNYNGLWSPSIHKVGNQWLLYVSLVRVNTTPVASGICVLKSTKCNGLWHSPVILFENENTLGNIDPFVYNYKGELYLFYGSTEGIYYRKLSQDGLSLDTSFTPVHVAGLTSSEDSTRETVFEGVHLYQRNNYLYMFVSSGKTKSTNYKLKVGRAELINEDGSLPFVFYDKDGNNLTTGNATTILSDSIRSPGHNGNIFVDSEGKTYIFYHGRLAEDSSGYDRATYLQELKWDNEDWPYFENGSIAETEIYPFNVRYQNKDIGVEYALKDTVVDLTNGTTSFSAVKIGNTTLTEAQLQQLLALLN